MNMVINVNIMMKWWRWQRRLGTWVMSNLQHVWKQWNYWKFCCDICNDVWSMALMMMNMVINVNIMIIWWWWQRRLGTWAMTLQHVWKQWDHWNFRDAWVLLQCICWVAWVGLLKDVLLVIQSDCYVVTLRKKGWVKIQKKSSLCFNSVLHSCPNMILVR